MSPHNSPDSSGANSGAVIAGITDLLPVFRQRAQEAEDGRVVPAESVKALAETGFFKLLQPKSFGGLEADPVTFFTAVRLIASACGSTGWVASVVGVHPWQLALFPPQAQQDVWSADPATRMSSSYAPTGKAKQFDRGYRLDGRWSFSSGCDHASWVLLGGIVTNDEGQPTDFRTFLLPASDYVIDDVWDTVGLRGTGSNDIIVSNAFVPEHRSLSFTNVTRCACPGQEANTGALYRIPFGSIFSYAITTPVIGMATGAYAAHVEYQRGRVRASYEVTGTGQAIRAVDLLFENSGGRALKMGTPIQRFWRDAHAGRVHAINDPERALSMFGRGEFGHDVPPDAMF